MLPSAAALPDPLAAALTDAAPGPALPPGPRMNLWRAAGAEPVPVRGALAALVDVLGRPGPPHVLDDGTVTGVPRRAVPSAGGAHPVHVHVAVGPAGLPDCGLGPGRYVVDHATATLLRRPGPAPSTGSQVVLTVQPGRSFGRYRRRAWPLWIADAAYALEAVRFLLDAPGPARVGPAADLRALLHVPAAAEVEAWRRRGLAPEIVLAAVPLPEAPRVDPVRAAALAARRSPRLAEFAARRAAGHPPDPRAVAVARASGQAWVAGAAAVHVWTTRPQQDPVALAADLWRIHRAAARRVYAGALAGAVRCRPVSGMPAGPLGWPVHALACLPDADAPRPTPGGDPR
ncbi:hypothetical protein NNL26_00875 [Micrococcus luteus]|uniref:hypothetical protein n=1 Tax=Micrococcus luteus TaxID=1270 RepID=UPI0021085A82|nr:hypothetical protein [Micrococcus luteus]UTX34838.1 hypothetical protein NNL26_00875 [Micrococcus luteus]